MPPPILRAFITMKPVISARESLREVNVTAAGAGQLKRESRRRILREFNRAARYQGQRPEPPSRTQIAANLAGIGVKVEFMPKKEHSAE